MFGMSKSSLFEPSDLTSRSCFDLVFQSGGTRSTDTMLVDPPGAAASALSGVLASPAVILTRYLPGLRPLGRGILYSPLVIAAPLCVPCPSNGSKRIDPSLSGWPASVTLPVTSWRPAYGSEHPARAAAA